MATRTRSRKRTDPELPDSDTLDRLKLSPEVAHYLTTRSIPLPDCPPAWKTPEPGEVLTSARFDPERVDKVLAAFTRLRHTQGRHAGKPLKPDPWQVAYIIAPAFGWVRYDDDAGRWVRVITELYVDVPRKNGKTTLCGGLALYMTGGDGEAGAQVLAAATTKDQAGFTFAPVKGLVDASPDLRKNFKAYAKKITHPRSGSYFTVVASVAEALHGANLHAAVVDELHVHKDGALLEAIETGTGSRDQPMVAIITTADDGAQATPYDIKRRRIEQLADRVLKLPHVYGVIWAAPENADPFTEETWKVANPGYGISPTKSFLARQAAKAKDDPAELASFSRLHLGIRSDLDVKYIPLDVWDRNAGLVDVAALAGREAFGGLDLASTSDLTALCWTFPDDAGGFDVLWHHWVPERAFRQLCKKTSNNARAWRDAGWLTVTDGDVTDYNFIRAQIDRDMDTYDVGSIAYDRWNSSQLVVELTNDHVPMESMGQGFVSMSAPTKGLLHTLLTGSAEDPKYRHGGNPLVRWQIDNLRVQLDPAGNVKPAKDRSLEKIDGLVAGIMSLDRAINRPEKRVSAYETEGLAVV